MLAINTTRTCSGRGAGYVRRRLEPRPEYPYDDSNADPLVRSQVLSPLSYKGLVEYQGLEPCELSLQGTAGAQDHTPCGQFRSGEKRPLPFAGMPMPRAGTGIRTPIFWLRARPSSQLTYTSKLTAEPPQRSRSDPAIFSRPFPYLIKHPRQESNLPRGLRRPTTRPLARA